MLELNCDRETPSWGGELLGPGLPEWSGNLLPALHHPTPFLILLSLGSLMVGVCGKLSWRLGWQSQHCSLSCTQPWFGLPPAKLPVAHTAPDQHH